MELTIAGQTRHFIVRYDPALGGDGVTVAQHALAWCELDLFRLGAAMPYQNANGQDPFTNPTIDIQILNDPLGGPGYSSADNNGHFPGRQSRIRIKPLLRAGHPDH